MNKSLIDLGIIVLIYIGVLIFVGLSILQLVANIKNILGILANHLQHHCDKCKTESEIIRMHN